MNQPLQNLEQLLDHIGELARNNHRVSMAMIVESIGSRSFGPMLMLIGIILYLTVLWWRSGYSSYLLNYGPLGAPATLSDTGWLECTHAGSD